MILLFFSHFFLKHFVDKYIFSFPETENLLRCFWFYRKWARKKESTWSTLLLNFFPDFFHDIVYHVTIYYGRIFYVSSKKILVFYLVFKSVFLFSFYGIFVGSVWLFIPDYFCVWKFFFHCLKNASITASNVYKTSHFFRWRFSRISAIFLSGVCR